MIRISNREQRSVDIGVQIQSGPDLNDGEEGHLKDLSLKGFDSFDAALDYIFTETSKYNYANMEYQSPEQGTLRIKTEPMDGAPSFYTRILTLDNFEPDEIMLIVRELESRNFQRA